MLILSFAKRGKSILTHFVAIYAKTYRNILAYEPILETCDDFCSTEHNISDVMGGRGGSSWYNTVWHLVCGGIYRRKKFSFAVSTMGY